MLFSVNQASHLYVVKNYGLNKEVVENIGDIVVKTTKDNQNLYFSYMGEGGILRSDLIPIKNIMHYSYKSALELITPLRKAVITLNEDSIVAGQDYLIKIKYSIGSIDNQYLKYGVVRGTKGMTVSEFFQTMKTSLEKNFAREDFQSFTFTAGEDRLTIKENEPKWILGTYPQRPTDFEITVDTIEVDGVEITWGNVEYAKATEADGTYFYPNSKKIADLEYFCMGERGDQYKNYGWPNVIPTKYMVNPNESGYDVINIHYAYTGSNEAVQKSEKDIFLVGTRLYELSNSIKPLIGIKETEE